MRSSTVLVSVAILATAAPTLAAPVSKAHPVSTNQAPTSSAATATPDEDTASTAHSLSNIGKDIDRGSDVVNAVGTLKSLFGSTDSSNGSSSTNSSDTSQQRRGFDTRQVQTNPDAASAALSLSTIGKIVDGGADVINAIGTLSSFFRRDDSSSGQLDPDVVSAALSLSKIGKGLDRGTNVVSAIGTLSSLFGGSSDSSSASTSTNSSDTSQQRRDLAARQIQTDPDAGSAAFSLKGIGSIIKAGEDVVGDLFGGGDSSDDDSDSDDSDSNSTSTQRRRRLAAHPAHATKAKAASLHNVMHPTTHAARATPDDASAALSLKSLGSIIKDGKHVADAVGDLLGGDGSGNSTSSRRSLAAQQVPSSSPSASAASEVHSINGIHLGPGPVILSPEQTERLRQSESMQQQQRRALVEVLVRQAAQDPSAAPSLQSLYNLAIDIANGLNQQLSSRGLNELD